MKRDEAVEGLDILHEALAAKTKEAAWALLFDKTPTLLDPIRAALESAERAEVGPVEAAARTLYDALEWRLSPNLVRGDLASDEWAAFLALGRVLGGSPQPAKPEAGPSREAHHDQDECDLLWDALNAIEKDMRCRRWITEGRGPYEWDDDRYKDEAGHAFRAVMAIISGVTPKASRAHDKALARCTREVERGGSNG